MLLFAAAVLLAGCGEGIHVPASEEDAGIEGCIDLDSDGFGVGAWCKGADCDDGDPRVRTAAQCEARCVTYDGIAPGCPCDVMDTRTCYLGPSGTIDVGACRAGLMTCDGGRWGICDGALVPSDELCDAIDNDCDGTVDEEVVNECGSCGDCSIDCVGDGPSCDPWDPTAQGEGVVSCDADPCVTLAGADPGTYRHVFEGCMDVNEWLGIAFEADFPDGSSIEWRARAADTPDELAALDFVVVGVSPADEAPIGLGLDFDWTRYLELEVLLVPGKGGAPVLWRIEAEYTCGWVGIA